MNPENSTDDVIRISRDEATSDHVDDMLKRQMSLRGDPGVTREHGRRWYLQNWFVFGVVGMLAAIAAWGIIEPMFSDMIYLQGPIEQISVTASFKEDGISHRDMENDELETGWIQIKGQKIWLLTKTASMAKDGSLHRVHPADFEKGDEVGVYVKCHELQGEEVAMAYRVTSTLQDQSPKKASMTLHELKSRSTLASLLLFPLVAGLIGLAIGAVDGIICRLPRRAILSGLVGLLVGFIGGFITHILAEVIYVPLNHLATHQLSHGAMSTLGFVVQVMGRSLAWAMAGLAMGLGQGIALRSRQLLLYGLVGGAIGGLLGGMLFDPLDMLLPGDHISAHWSRLAGLAAVGMAVGVMMGVVELFARDAWLRMVQGPLAGKEFLLFKDVMNIGSSPKSDIYLFNDTMVASQHAILRGVGDECEVQSQQQDNKVLLNGRPVKEARLRHGDQVTIGRTVFVFEKRKQ